jgi:hypothetical protein
MTCDDLGETHEPAAPRERAVAIPPVIAPEHWADFDGFRETFLVDFTVPEHNAVLRRLCDVLSALIGEAARVMPKSPEGWYRTQVRAALADLRFLQGYLTETAEAGVWNIPAGDEALVRLVRRQVKALGKIAAAIEGALDLPRRTRPSVDEVAELA